MRAAFVTNFCPFYRAPLFRLLGQKINARFLFFSTGAESYWDKSNPSGKCDLPVVELHNPPCGKLRLAWRIARELCLGDYDVLIAGISGRYFVFLTYVIARLRGIPFVLWTGLWHHPSTLFHRLTSPVTRYLYRIADAHVVYGTHVRDYLCSLGVQAQRIFIAPNTTDNELYNKPASHDEIEEIRRMLQISAQYVILFVGRLQLEKGVHILLNAVQQLGLEPPPAVLIIGHGPQEVCLKDYCETAHLHNVLFKGYVPNSELYRYYAAADVVVVPSVTTRSFKEPWGLVVNEAMNQGRVVIASDAVGAARGGLIQDGINGIIVPEGDASALGRVMKALLTDPEIRFRIGAAARRTVAAWTYERMAEGFLQAVAHATKTSCLQA